MSVGCSTVLPLGKLCLPVSKGLNILVQDGEVQNNISELHNTYSLGSNARTVLVRDKLGSLLSMIVKLIESRIDEILILKENVRLLPPVLRNRLSVCHAPQLELIGIFA